MRSYLQFRSRHSFGSFRSRKPVNRPGIGAWCSGQGGGVVSDAAGCSGLLSGCQGLEGDLPEPPRRVGVERVGGDAMTGAGLAWSCLVAVFEVAAADSLEQR